MAVVEFKDVAKSYGRVFALKGASFRLPRGVLAGLLGPNGSGKTTTLKLAAGLLRRNSGLIEVFGVDPWVNCVEVRARIGLLHERPLYPGNVRVKDLLGFLARLRGYGAEEALRVARLVGLGDYMEYRVYHLSRGYLQRLGLAQALIGDPDLLLLDEPTANLDPMARLEILRLISALKRELKVTVIVSSHIIPELREVCDYAIFISGGVVTAYGPLEDLSKAFPVEAEYEVVTPAPRELASRLVSEDFVKAVEIRDERLKVRVSGQGLEEFLRLIEEFRTKGSVLEIRHVGADLGDLYARIIGSSG